MSAELVERLNFIVDQIELPEGFVVEVNQDDDGHWYLQIRCWRKDVVTGEMGFGWGGRGYCAEHITLSEVVQTAFGLYKAYVEHEARETFSYRGRLVFGPHMDINAVWSIANQTDSSAGKS